MNIFVLEDDNNRIKKFRRELIGHNVDYAKTMHEGVLFVLNNQYDLIFLDHDLGGLEMVDSDSPEGTGYHVAVEITTSMNKNTLCIVHSCNPHGAAMMNKVLTNSELAPFTALNIKGAVELAKGSNNEHS